MNTRRLNGVKMNRATFNAIGEVTKKKAEGGGKVPNGVYIQHIDGNLYTSDEWTAKAFANADANGVAVVSDKASFVISIQQAFKTRQWSSDTTNATDGVTAATSLEAKTDYKGKHNTLFIPKDSTTGDAAYYVDTYTFPNGQKGYLPAMGELAVCAKPLLTEINEILGQLGGDYLQSSSLYWTSTQANATQAWLIRLYDGTVLTRDKSDKEYSRAFTELIL